MLSPRGDLLYLRPAPGEGDVFSIPCTPSRFSLQEGEQASDRFSAFHSQRCLSCFNSQSSLMDKITPSREAATVTTAKGMSIGYVPVFVLGTITHLPFPPQPLGLSRGCTGLHSRVTCSGAQRCLNKESQGGWARGKYGPGHSWKKQRGD